MTEEGENKVGQLQRKLRNREILKSRERERSPNLLISRIKRLQITITGNDYREIEIVTKRREQIHGKISDLILQFEKLKIDEGKSAWAVRQWKKETKEKFLRQLDDKEGLLLH